MSSQNRIGVILVAVVAVSIAALAFNRDTTAAAETSLGDVSVSCGPSQRAVVQRTGAGAATQINVQCVDTEASQSSAHAIVAAGPGTPVASAIVPAVSMPAVMYQPAPHAVQVAPLPAAPPVPRTPARRAVERKPSLQKRLLIIGGSSGVGAGVGALVGGKKGALIGAAIAGGGATIVDQVKHR